MRTCKEKGCDRPATRWCQRCDPCRTKYAKQATHSYYVRNRERLLTRHKERYARMKADKKRTLLLKKKKAKYDAERYQETKPPTVDLEKFNRSETVKALLRE